MDDFAKHIIEYLDFLDRRSLPSSVARTNLETILLVDANTDIRVWPNVTSCVIGTVKGVDVHSCFLSCSIQNEGLYGSCTPSATRSPLGWTVRRT